MNYSDEKFRQEKEIKTINGWKNDSKQNQNPETKTQY